MTAYKDTKTGKWYCQFWHTDWTGVKKHKVKRGFNRKKDAEEWEREYKQSKVDKTVVMGTVIESFIKDMDNKVDLGYLKTSTRLTKERNVRFYIEPYFKSAKVEEIKGKNVTEWLTIINTSTDRIRMHKRMSSSTLIILKNLLSQLFEYSRVNFYTTNNPTKTVSNPSEFTNSKREKFWTLETYTTFYKSISDKKEPYKVIFNIMFFAGLRIGEILALTPEDISKYEINVNKTKTDNYVAKYMHVVAKPSEITTPKTDSSVRKVQIPVFLYDQIQDYISKHYLPELQTEIFLMSSKATYNFLKRRVEKLGLPYISQHTLRHSFATLKYKITKDFLLVANNLGHKNAMVTAKFYAFLEPSEARNGIDEIEKMKPF